MRIIIIPENNLNVDYAQLAKIIASKLDEKHMLDVEKDLSISLVSNEEVDKVIAAFTQTHYVEKKCIEDYSNIQLLELETILSRIKEEFKTPASIGNTKWQLTFQRAWMRDNSILPKFFMHMIVEGYEKQDENICKILKKSGISVNILVVTCQVMLDLSK